MKHIKLFEEESSAKNFLISFTNEKFHISSNTLTSFVNKLRVIDPELKHDPKSVGNVKDGKGLVVRSSVLTHDDITSLIKEFVQKYDWLKMNVVVTKHS